MSIRYSASRGDLQTVLDWLAQNQVDIDEALPLDGLTPLHLASQNGHVSVAKALVDSGADVNVNDAVKVTPLQLACRHGQWGVASLLLGNQLTEIPASALHDAIFYGNLPIFKMMVNHGACLKFQKGVEPKSLLHVACERGHLDAVMYLLLEHTFDVNSRDNLHKTPLHYAAASGFTEIAQFLVANGQANVNPTDLSGNTPLTDATRNGPFLPLMKYLLDSGADVNKANRDGETPLLIAARHENRHEKANSYSAMKLLVENGAMVNHRDILGTTALHHASSQFYYVPCMTLLLQYGAKVDAKTIRGETPLHFAATWKENVHAVRVLVEHGANVSPVGQIWGESPLHRSVSRGSLAMVSFLLHHGAEVNAQDKYGKTPIYFASRDGRVHKLQSLLLTSQFNSPAPNLRLVDTNCQTALHVARNVEVARCLLESHPGHHRSALLHIKNARGESPWKHYSYRQDEELVTLMESYMAVPLVDLEYSSTFQAVSASAGHRKRKRDETLRREVKFHPKLTPFQLSLGEKILSVLEDAGLQAVASTILTFLSPGDVLDLGHVVTIE